MSRLPLSPEEQKQKLAHDQAMDILGAQILGIAPPNPTVSRDAAVLVNDYMSSPASPDFFASPSSNPSYYTQTADVYQDVTGDEPPAFTEEAFAEQNADFAEADAALQEIMPKDAEINHGSASNGRWLPTVPPQSAPAPKTASVAQPAISVTPPAASPAPSPVLGGLLGSLLPTLKTASIPPPAPPSPDAAPKPMFQAPVAPAPEPPPDPALVQQQQEEEEQQRIAEETIQWIQSTVLALFGFKNASVPPSLNPGFLHTFDAFATDYQMKAESAQSDNPEGSEVVAWHLSPDPNIFALIEHIDTAFVDEDGEPLSIATTHYIDYLHRENLPDDDPLFDQLMMQYPNMGVNKIKTQWRELIRQQHWCNQDNQAFLTILERSLGSVPMAQDRILAIKASLCNTDRVTSDLAAFIPVAEALTQTTVHPGDMPELDPVELAKVFSFFDYIFPEDIDWSDDIIAYVAARLHHEGFVIAPSMMRFANDMMAQASPNFMQHDEEGAADHQLEYSQFVESVQARYRTIIHQDGTAPDSGSESPIDIQLNYLLSCNFAVIDAFCASYASI